MQLSTKALDSALSSGRKGTRVNRCANAKHVKRDTVDSDCLHFTNYNKRHEAMNSPQTHPTLSHTYYHSSHFLSSSESSSVALCTRRDQNHCDCCCRAPFTQKQLAQADAAPHPTPSVGPAGEGWAFPESDHWTLRESE